MSQNRKEQLVNILMRLHEGASPEDVQADFNRHFSSVSALEIAAMEQEIISDPGPITFEDVLKLCNVHAELFKGKIDPAEAEGMEHPDHPVQVFKNENFAMRACLSRIENIIQALGQMSESDSDLEDLYDGLLYQFKLLGQFERHYDRKEKLFFPILEKKGYTAPPKVMWAKDDEIRKLYADCFEQIKSNADPNKIYTSFKAFKEEFIGMIFKEEAILLSLLMESFSNKDWLHISQESSAYGYTMIQEPNQWLPKDAQKNEEEKLVSQNQQNNEMKTQTIQSTQIETNEGTITLSWQPHEKLSQQGLDRETPIAFNHGSLSLNEIQLIMDHLPLEVTFVDKNDIFRYFNNAHPAEEMIFKRTPSQIGRDIELCHPPKSWEKVNQLFSDLRIKRRTSESMWFKRGDGVYVYVTYRGVYDQAGEFQGVLETVQDIQSFVNLPSPMKVDLSDLEE